MPEHEDAVYAKKHLAVFPDPCFSEWPAFLSLVS
jgi:hypothetical protein